MIVIAINSISLAQEREVLRALDNNIFKLSNQDTVKLKFLRTVSINRSSGTPSTLAKKIYKWVDAYFTGRTFKVEYTGEQENNIKLVNMYRTYELGDDENVLGQYLSRGYGEYSGEDKFLKEKELSAKENGLGVWGEDSINIGLYPDKKYYEHPYIFLLPLSAFCFGLAWDQFEGASDIQGTIDALNNAGLSSEADELQGSKTRKTIVGIVGILAGITTAVLAFRNVEVKSDYDSVTLGVNIPLNK